MIHTIRELIENKSVLILGYGREGRSSWQRIKEAGSYSRIAIADMNHVQLEEGHPAELICGPDYQKCLDDFDVVFKSPGIVLERDIHDYRCEIVSQTELFFRRFGRQCIGITGTKGKSTTTTMIYHILKETGHDCVLVGNIGIPMFDMLDQINEQTLIVCELSCHQLEEGSYKGRLIKVCDRDEEGRGTTAADVTVSGSVIKTKKHTYQIPTAQIRLIGHHNYVDIAFVYAVCAMYDISDEDFSKALMTYHPLPHRLQYIGEACGIRFYDDSISTICDTTIQALKSLPDTDAVLIGGMDRGIDYSELIQFLSVCDVPHIILMEATGRRIFEEIGKYYPAFNGTERIKLVYHLDGAVALAKKICRQGHCCVMSPAAASYGIFKNFEARGEAFAELVREGV